MFCLGSVTPGLHQVKEIMARSYIGIIADCLSVEGSSILPRVAKQRPLRTVAVQLPCKQPEKSIGGSIPSGGTKLWKLACMAHKQT